MQLIIDLPPVAEAYAPNLTRLRELHDDPYFGSLDGRMETNGRGEVILSPPPGRLHQDAEGWIERKLDELLGGEPNHGYPVSTSDGVKQVDACWYSRERHAELKDPYLPEHPPEICVEVISPSNTVREMEWKRRLYFEAGVAECWECDLHGRMHFYVDPTDPDTASDRSVVCPDFPNLVPPGVRR